MKGVRFYLEYPNKTEKHNPTGNHTGNVIAVFYKVPYWESKFNEIIYDCVMAISNDEPNSEVYFTTIPESYIREKCKRISAGEAFKIHPNLFIPLYGD